jgi:hypothetical protein
VSLVQALILTTVSMIALATFALLMLPLQSRLATRSLQRRLRAMTLDELAAVALRGAEACGLRERFADAALFREDAQWDASSLSKALTELCQQLATEDGKGGRSGPDGWVHVCRDHGLLAVSEVLEERTAAREDFAGGD